MGVTMSLPELTRAEKGECARFCFRLSNTYWKEGGRFAGLSRAVLEDGYRLAREAGLDPRPLHLGALQEAGMASR